MNAIEQKRHDWWTNALKSNLTWMPVGTCHKCDKNRPGFIIYSDHKFTCVICRAKELFPEPA